MTSQLYFQTEPEGGVCLYHRSDYDVVNRVAHIPLDMSLDEQDQRLVADEWLLTTFPEPLPALAVRRIVARRDLGRAQSAANLHG